MEAYKAFDDKKGPFSTFAYAYVRHEMVSLLQKETDYTTHCALTNDIFDYMTDQTTDSDMDYDDLSPYLTRLSEREKTWVIEFAKHDLRLVDIAQKYGVSRETVKSWRKQALKKLRN